MTFTLPQLAAAASALIVFAAGGTAVVLSRAGASGRPAAAAASPTIGPGATPVASPGYDAAVAKLEQALELGRSRLDTATVRVLEKNLRIIDRAIVEARGALERDPGNPFLNHHLAEQMRRKLELLRRANALALAQS